MRCSRRSARAALRVLAALAALSSAAQPSHALTIVGVFDASVTSAFQTAFNYAATEFQNAFSDPVTLTIDVTTSTSVSLGQSTYSTLSSNYAQVRSALISDQAGHPSANGATSVASGGSLFSTTDPTGGATFWVSSAEAKALGFGGNAVDGTFTYNPSLSYTTNPASRGSGGYDFIGVAEHEISEIMGRFTGNGGTIGVTPNSYAPLDLFSFSGSNARAMGNGSGRYFSIDNGLTNLHAFNSGAGDLADWDTSLASDPFNVVTGANQAHALNATDLATLDVIGWDLVSAVPEVRSWILMLAGIGAVAGVTRRTPRS